MVSFSFKNNYIGKIEKQLGIGFFGHPSWKWKKVHFKGFDIDINKELNPHIMILGESGSGKSNTCKLILNSLSRKGVQLMVFDAHNEYIRIANDISAKVYNAAYNGLNIMGLDGISIKERSSELTEMIKSTFRLGEVQASALFNCISYTYKISMENQYEPTIKDLLFTIKIFKKHANKYEIKTLESIEKRLAVLNAGIVARPKEFSEFLKNSCIFALSDLHTNEAQKLYIEAFLKRIYTRMLIMEKSDKIVMYIVIDEAEKLDDESIISRIISEGRKYGIGVITIAQRAKGLHKSIRSNSSTIIAFYQKEPEELNYISNMLSGGNELNRFTEIKKALRSLRKGYAIFSGAVSDPAIVRFKEHIIHDEYIGNYLIDECKRGISRKSLISRMKKRNFEEQKVDKEMLRLKLEKTITDFNIAESAEGRMKGPIPGIWYISMAQNSAEHDIYVNLISRHLKRLNIHNLIYNTSYSPDLVAFYKGKIIAIEYETGLKNINDTKRMLEGRRKRYASVITLINDNYAKSFNDNGIKCIPISAFLSSDLPITFV
jgi:adenylate kinase family enzyme